GEELVVPGLDAGAIALADPADLLRGAAGLQLLGRGDLGPGPSGVAVVGRIHSLEQRLAVGADVEEVWTLDDGVSLVTAGREHEGHATLRFGGDPAGRVGEVAEMSSAVVRDVETIGRGARAPSGDSDDLVARGPRPQRDVGDHVADREVEVAAGTDGPPGLQHSGPVAA